MGQIDMCHGDYTLHHALDYTNADRPLVSQRLPLRQKSQSCVPVWTEKATHEPNVLVNYLNSAIRFWHQELGMNDLLDCKNYTILDTHPDGSPGGIACQRISGCMT
jgi:hypothetical protein